MNDERMLEDVWDQIQKDYDDSVNKWKPKHLSSSTWYIELVGDGY